MNEHRLHVLNGDALISRFEHEFPGERYISWGEALINGPSPSQREKGRIQLERVQFLSTFYGVDAGAVKAKLHNLYDRIDDVRTSRTVLWFDDDLFCCANFSYLLHLIELGAATLVRPRDSGPLLPQLNSSIPLTEEIHLEWRRFWTAFSAPSPEGLPDLLRSKVPSVRSAAESALARLPCPSGLTYPQRIILEILLSETLSFTDLFVRFKATSPHDFGFGDWDLWLIVRSLCDGERPAIFASERLELPGMDLKGSIIFEATEWSKKYLDGALTFTQSQINCSNNSDIWRWDPPAKTLSQMSETS